MKINLIIATSNIYHVSYVFKKNAYQSIAKAFSANESNYLSLILVKYQEAVNSLIIYIKWKDSSREGKTSSCNNPMPLLGILR